MSKSQAYQPVGMAAPTASDAMPAMDGMSAATGILDYKTTARTFRIDWATYEKSNFLKKAELELMTAYIAGTEAAKKNFLDLHGSTFFTTLISFLNKVSKNETLQFLLTMIDDILAEDASRINLFHEVSKITGQPAWQTFLQIVETKEDLYVQHQANRILVQIVVNDGALLNATSQQGYFAWVTNTIQSKEHDSAILALTSLHALLRSCHYRQPFFEYADSITQLRALLQLDAAHNIQLQYKAMVVFWVLTFDHNIAGILDKEGGPLVIGDIASLMRASRKEKVQRMCISTLANMITNPTTTSLKKYNAQQMISHKVLPIIELRAENENEDDVEVLAAIKTLQTSLSQIFEDMSSFDEYASEISSGLLEWSPVHRSDKFWRENAVKLNDDRHKLVKILIQLLETSSDPQVLSIAAHDCGEYVRHYPRGKQVIETLGGKGYIMKHMTNPDSAVRYEALIAVQKLMTQNWGQLGGSLQTAN